MVTLGSWGCAGVHFERISPDCAEHLAVSMVVGDDLGGGDVAHVCGTESVAAPLFHHGAKNRGEGAGHCGHGRFQQGFGITPLPLVSRTGICFVGKTKFRASSPVLGHCGSLFQRREQG